MTEPIEAEVVEAARLGDPEAWRFLYRRVYSRLRAYLARQVGAEHVDEAISETMTRAVARVDSFELGAAGFDGWLFGIARRVAADHHRRFARWQRHSLLTTRNISDDEASDTLLRSEEHRRMRRAFDALTDDERELLELRIVADLTTEEVAAILGKSVGAVRTAQSRALAHLRRLLQEDNGHD
jgi:RNA polymerase sigma-70 factor (ECF subfamily)